MTVPSEAPTKGKGRGKYRLADGTRVPSVTEVLSRFKEGGALIHWAWRLGMEGEDYRQKRDNAASIGTVVHSAAENWIHGCSLEQCEERIVASKLSDAEAAQALRGFLSFVRWSEKHCPAWVETELPLVSERHRFAGCIDAVARCGPDLSDLWQIDFKTSKSVYPDHLLQIAAYDLLHEEVRGRRFSRFTLLHIPKDGSECKAYDWTDLSAARDMFLQLRGALELEKTVKKLLKEKGVKVY